MDRFSGGKSFYVRKELIKNLYFFACQAQGNSLSGLSVFEGWSKETMSSQGEGRVNIFRGPAS